MKLEHIAFFFAGWAFGYWLFPIMLYGISCAGAWWRSHRAEPVTNEPSMKVDFNYEPRHWEVQLDGVKASILRAGKSPGEIVIHGHHPGHWHWAVGDYMLISVDGRTTRYKITEMERPGSSAYFATCKFAPRKPEEHQRSYEY